MTDDVAAVAITEFEEAHRVCVTALRGAVDRDWSVPAGSLVWPATLTAAHLTDVLFSYAFQAAAHATRGTLPFQELEAGPGADAEGLVDGIHASGVLLSSVLRCMPDGATSPWGPTALKRGVAAPEWAAMGARETLLHCYDIAVGVGVELVPPPDAAARAFDQWHLRRRVDPADQLEPGPELGPGEDPWAALVRASGRPFGEDEWNAWRIETEERRGRPAPAGSEAGVISDFADGIPSSRFGNGWAVHTDERIGGKSVGDLEVIQSAGPAGAHALRAHGTIEESETSFPYGGVVFRAGAARGDVANLSQWGGVRFWARGADRTLSVLSLTPGGWGGRHVVPLSDEWAPHRLPFHYFGTDGSDLTGLMFVAAWVPGDYWFELGDVRLF